MTPYVLGFEAGWIGGDPGAREPRGAARGQAVSEGPPGCSLETVEKREGGEKARGPKRVAAAETGRGLVTPSGDTASGRREVVKRVRAAATRKRRPGGRHREPP